MSGSVAREVAREVPAVKNDRVAKAWGGAAGNPECDRVHPPAAEPNVPARRLPGA